MSNSIIIHRCSLLHSMVPILSVVDTENSTIIIIWETYSQPLHLTFHCFTSDLLYFVALHMSAMDMKNAILLFSGSVAITISLPLFEWGARS